MIAIAPAAATDADIAAQILRASIIQLCVADHRNDPQIISGWTANKTPERFQEWLRDPDLSLFVARRDGAAAGVGGATRDGKIILNYIAPDHVGHGVGRALLTAMEADLVANGVERGALDSTETALPFYERNGWRRAGCASSKLGPGVPGLSCNPMQKDLQKRA